MDEEQNIDKEIDPENAGKNNTAYDASADDESSDEDIVFDDEGEYAGETIKKLRERLKKAIAEKQEYLDGWKRSQADAINAKRKEEDARKEYAKFIREDMIVQLLPVLDSFEMAFGNKESWEKVDPAWRKGVEYIYSQLSSVLAANELAALEPKTGEPFNPAYHQAVELVATDNPGSDNAIVEVVQKGYLFNGRVLRPAKVKVGEIAN